MNILQKYTTWIVIIVSTLLIGCETYKSKLPISDSSVSTINDSWLGRWVGLDTTEFQFYPRFEINLQAFNDKEYVATFTIFKNTGKTISSVDLFKVFNTSLNSGEYLNIKPIGSIDEDFIFYKIEKDLKDSIFIRYLTDSLKLKFQTSKEFGDFLVEGEKNETEILSQPFPFYRWRSLIWDRINKINNSSQFDRFYILGRLDENYIKEISDDELEELVVDKEEIEIDFVRDYFKGIRLSQEGTGFWKVPNYGVIKMKSGEFIKIKYDLRGPFIMDLTNNIKYVNSGNETTLVSQY